MTAVYVDPDGWPDEAPTLPGRPRESWGAYPPDASEPVAIFGSRRDADDWLLSGAGDAWPDLTIRKVRQ